MSEGLSRLDELFDDCTESAVRIEARDVYETEQQRRPVEEFLAGRLPGPEWMAEWMDYVRDRTSKGVRFARVRITRRAFTDYRRFNLYNCRFNVEAGEDIRYLYRDHAIAANLPLYDYWLFDGRVLALMGYDETDRFNGIHVIEDHATTTRHHDWFEIAHAAATPWKQFVQQTGR